MMPERARKFSLAFDPKTAYLHEERSYHFGLDPIWNLADNRLNFVNSMKVNCGIK
jgi:V-type H+-transporting ATPase subunit a